MKVTRYVNASEFLRRSESWLLQSEAENNLMLGIARRLCDESSPADCYWVTVSHGRAVAGAAFRTPPYPLALADLPPESVPLLVRDVAEVYSSIPGVSGPSAVAKRFADLWVDRNRGSWRVRLRQRIHALTELNELGKIPAGNLRRMEPSDSALILEWMGEFVREAAVLGSAEQFAGLNLKRRNFYIWDDNGPRSVAAIMRDSPNGACISAVFTPPAYRRMGYATATVAALSGTVLTSGKQFCCLYTDLANPTSNSIYRRIGYKPVRDDAVLVFE